MIRKLSFHLLLVLAVLVLTAGPAWAHPAYKASSPGSGATVAEPPSEVWVEFTERIDGGSLAVYDACGERVDHGEAEMNLTEDRLTVGTHGDKAGTYRVDWAALGQDSHTTRGQFTFSSSGGLPCPEEEKEVEEKPRPRDDEERPRPGTQQPSDDENSETTTTAGNASQEGSRRPRAVDRREDRAAQRDRVRPSDTDSDGPDVALETDSEAVSVWEGIPKTEYLVALGVAALIGAAGGRIYAGIVGPAEPRERKRRKDR